MVTTSGTEFKSLEERIEEADDAECQERYSNMPPIGTRVKRGPEWRFGDQDKHGPGTVIGHSTRRKLFNHLYSMVTQSQYLFTSICYLLTSVDLKSSISNLSIQLFDTFLRIKYLQYVIIKC